MKIVYVQEFEIHSGLVEMIYFVLLQIRGQNIMFITFLFQTVPTHIWVSLIKERLQKEDCISKVKSLLAESLNNSFNHGHHGFCFILASHHKKKIYFSLSFCSQVFSRRGKIITIVLLLNLKSKKKKHQLGDYQLIQYQILQTHFVRIEQQTVRTITNEILAVLKGSKG